MTDALQQLKDYRSLRRDIAWLEERIARLRSSIVSVTQVITDMPHGSHKEKDPLGWDVARLLEMEAQWAAMLVQAEGECMAAVAFVSALPEPERRVISARYIDGMSWGEVARYIGYSKSQCMRINSHFLKRCDPMRPFSVV